VKSDNGVSFFNVIDDVNQPDTGRTNQFVYREKIAAAYLMYNLKLKKWEMQAGVRGEHTAAEGTLTTLSKSLVQAVDTSYFNLFPSATVTYNFNDESSLGIAYSKRIDRPNYRSLNPFEFVLDELTYSKGNPFLRPQYTNTIKLSQNYRKLNVSVSYSNNKDYMMSFIDTIDGRKSYETRINMYYQKLYDLNIFYQLPVAKWWDADFNLYYYYEDIKGLAGKNILHRTQNSYSLSTNHTFRLPHKWTMELSAFYNSRSLWGAFIVDPQWTVDAGVQKKILKDAGIIKLSVSDIFNSLQLSNVRDFGGYYIKSDRTWETTQLRLSFSYKFGNLKLQGPRNRDTGVEEEERRAK
jgi:outer membrane receptor protein involved in Fe transport